MTEAVSPCTEATSEAPHQATYIQHPVRFIAYLEGAYDPRQAQGRTLADHPSPGTPDLRISLIMCADLPQTGRYP